MTVAGIDPGTGRIGYALLEAAGGQVRIRRAETIRVPPAASAAQRLAAISRALEERLTQDRPAAVALERIFFARNAKTAMAVAEARGVILLTALRHVRSIWEYTPLEVKTAVTGYGRSDKANLRRMVKILFPGVPLPAGDDAIDAIAIALTALWSRRQPT